MIVFAWHQPLEVLEQAGENQISQFQRRGGARSNATHTYDVKIDTMLDAAPVTLFCSGAPLEIENLLSLNIAGSGLTLTERFLSACMGGA